MKSIFMLKSVATHEPSYNLLAFLSHYDAQTAQQEFEAFHAKKEELGDDYDYSRLEAHIAKAPHGYPDDCSYYREFVVEEVELL